jgi:outer membrane protein assembly factor BamB
MPFEFMPSSARRRRRRRWPWILAALVLVGAGAAVGAYLAFFQPAGDVSHPNVEFTNPTKAKKVRVGENFVWPIYGYDEQRTRDLDVNLHPPFRYLWTYKSGHLIEFQPVLAGGLLYFVKNDGYAIAISAKTGHRKWQRKIGSLNASSPAYFHGRIYVALLSKKIICLDAKTGKPIWKRDLPSRSESSPIVIQGVVYFGSEDGTIYALRADNGRKVWTFHAAGAVKAGLAYNPANGNLYFGDYSGEFWAIRRKTGQKVWSASTSSLAFGRSGNFYATPSVAYGRVFAGNTDGRMYSFAASSGKLAWRMSTGNYVYSAAAVGRPGGMKPTVFVGSYDGDFYALDARSGNTVWKYHAGGKISGAPTIVGHIVYFSNLASKTTIGLNVRTGRPVFRSPHGAFNPVISDGKRIYLTGYSSEFALVPQKSSEGAKAQRPAQKARSQAQAKSR